MLREQLHMRGNSTAHVLQFDLLTYRECSFPLSPATVVKRKVEQPRVIENGSPQCCRRSYIIEKASGTTQEQRARWKQSKSCQGMWSVLSVRTGLGLNKQKNTQG